MAALTFKPKKQQIHVPGHGVVQKENFTKAHFNILMKRAESGIGRDAFIKQHLEVASYGDQPLFAQGEKRSRKGKGSAAQSGESVSGASTGTEVVEINLDVNDLKNEVPGETPQDEDGNKPE